MHFVSSFEGLDDHISSVARLTEKIHRAEPDRLVQARLKDQIHGAEPGQVGSVARLKDKMHRAEPGQIGSGLAKRPNT